MWSAIARNRRGSDRFGSCASCLVFWWLLCLRAGGPWRLHSSDEGNLRFPGRPLWKYPTRWASSLTLPSHPLPHPPARELSHWAETRKASCEVYRALVFSIFTEFCKYQPNLISGYPITSKWNFIHLPIPPPPTPWQPLHWTFNINRMIQCVATCVFGFSHLA